MIKFLHTYWAVVVLLMFVITLFTFFRAFMTKKVFSYQKDFRIATFMLIVFYIQIVLGLINYFTSTYFAGLQEGKFGAYMKVAHDRQMVMEHPVMMLLALLLMHYGYNRMKKGMSSPKKYMSILIFYGIAFVMVLIRIPWKTWL